MESSEVRTSRRPLSNAHAEVGIESSDLAANASIAAADIALSVVAPGQTITTSGVVRNDVTLGAGSLLTEPTGGSLVIFGTVAGPSSGTAMMVIASGATLYAAGPVGASVSSSFAGSGGTLQLAGLYLSNMDGTISGFAPGEVIDVISQTLTDAVLTAAAGGGENLTLLDEGTVLATLLLADGAAGTIVFAVPDPVDGSRIMLGSALPAVTAAATGTSAGSVFAWGSTSQAGQWSDPAVWRTVNGVAVSLAPGGHDTVDITGPQTSVLSVAGDAAAATLSTQGLVALAGSFAIGSAQVGANSADVLLLTAGSQFVAGAATLTDGFMQVAAAGAVLTVTSLTALEGGTLWVADGGVVQISTVSLAGGSLRIGSTGAVSVGLGDGETGVVSIASGSTLSGNGAVYAPVLNSGLLRATGTLALFGLLSGGGVAQIAAGGELYIPNGAGATQQLEFQSSPGTLELFDSATTCAASIGGFGIGDVIDIASGTVSQAIWTSDGAGLNGTLDLGQAGTLSVSVAAGLNAATLAFDLEADGLGGTMIQVIPCFVRGTQLDCPGGTVAVEEVGVGDRLLTRTGAARRVRWVGHRYYDGLTLRLQPQLRPVRIRRGALGNGFPTHDICLSPQHAIAMTTPSGPRLVPAVSLVDGRSIARETPVAGVGYFHIELDDHDLLVSAGVPVESFLATGPESRTLFQAESGARGNAVTSIAPRLDQGADLEALRQDLGLPANLTWDISAEPMSGHIDALRINGSRLSIEGWAMCVGAPEHKLRLELTLGRAVIGTIVANRWRPDLDRAAFAGGRCGFSSTVDNIEPFLQMDDPAVLLRALPRSGSGYSLRRATLDCARVMGAARRSP